MNKTDSNKLRNTVVLVKKILFILCIVCIAATWLYVNYKDLFDISNDNHEELKVYFYDVGQGDCTIITCNGQTLVIDAGENDKGDDVCDYLNYLKIDKIDYLIGTHPDSDHIGGLDTVINKFNVRCVMLPEFTKDTKTYKDVIKAVKSSQLTVTEPVVGAQYSLGDASFTIIAPNRDYEDANNSSIGIILTHGNNRFLLTGDAELDAEADILKNGIDIHADVYKAAHHGSRTAVSDEFLAKVNPQYCVISCGEDNSYGHPHAALLNWLRQNNISTFRTDEQGTIIVTSDGSRLEWNMSPSETWQTGDRGK